MKTVNPRKLIRDWFCSETLFPLEMNRSTQDLKYVVPLIAVGLISQHIIGYVHQFLSACCAYLPNDILYFLKYLEYFTASSYTQPKLSCLDSTYIKKENNIFMIYCGCVTAQTIASTSSSITE